MSHCRVSREPQSKLYVDLSSDDNRLSVLILYKFICRPGQAQSTRQKRQDCRLPQLLQGQPRRKPQCAESPFCIPWHQLTLIILPANSANCCSGSHDIPATCPNSGVAFYHYFKVACPNSYAYPYGESSGTALWYCASSRDADYTIKFC